VGPGNNLETFTITYDDGSGATQTTTFTVQFTVLEVGAPTGEISIGTNKWNTFWNTVSFGLFAKETQNVTITNTTPSGEIDPANIDIYYYLSDIELTESEAKSLSVGAGGWQVYTAPISINPNDKKIIYAKLETNFPSDNKSVIFNTAGIVTYTDSTQSLQDKDISRPITGSLTGIDVTLNDNTVAGIVNETKGNQVLATPADYSESGGVITLTSSYLATLAGTAAPGTTYTFKVSYNPLGVAYPSTPLPGSEAPGTTTFTVTVSKSNQAGLSITSSSPHTFGSDYTIASSGGTGTGAVTYEIVSTGTTGEGSITGDALTITKAGTFILKATKAADDNYNVQTSGNFTLTVSAGAPDPEIPTGLTAVYGATLSSVDLSAFNNVSGKTPGIWAWNEAETTQVGEVGSPTHAATFTPTDTVNYTTLTNSYPITVTPKELTVDVTINNKKYDGTVAATVYGTPALVGIINSDDVTLGSSGVSFEFDTAAVGTSIPVTNKGTAYNLSGGKLGNYSLTQPSGLSANIIDGFTPVRDTHYTISTLSTGTGGAAGWTNNDPTVFTITAETDYELSLTNTAGGTWSTTLTAPVTETAGSTLTFYVKRTGADAGGIAQGEISTAGSETYKVDTTAPTATINYNTSGWRQFLNTITFGIFFKATTTVQIQGTDPVGSIAAGSGIKSVEYVKNTTVYASDSAALTEAQGFTSEWIVASGNPASFQILPADKGKYHIFTRITDNAGNFTIQYDSAVIYSDAGASAGSYTYEKGNDGVGTATVPVSITHNGNTILELRNTTDLNTLLTSGGGTPNYTYTPGTGSDIDNGTITLNNSYLSSLAAGGTGSTAYTFTVTYNPLGETFAADSGSSGGSIPNEAPGTTTFTVTVSKSNQAALSITSGNSHAFGSNYTIASSGGSGGGAVTYEIVPAGTTGTGNISGSTLTITTAGTFILKALKAGDPQYNATESAPFTLSVGKANQAALSLTGLGSSYTYGDAPVTNVSTTGGTTTGNVIYETTPVSGGAGSIVANDGAGTSATLTIAAPGTFTVTATKAGDTGYNEANVTSGSIKVNKAVPGVTVSASGGAIFGQDVSIEATVTKVGTGVVPTGSVDIYLDSGSTPVATNVTLNVQGKATYNLGALSGGPHTIEVRYSGNAYYKGNGATDNDDTTITGALGSTTHSVGLATDSISIADPGAKTYGDANFTIALGAAGAGTGANGGLGNGTGAVTWASSDLLVATVNANTGLVTITGRGAGGNGTTTITATKAADVNYNGTSATFSLTVAKATPSWNLVPTATALTYGNFLSASTLSGEVVKGAGTDSGTTRTGSVTWTAPGTVPDVTGINTANDKYGVTWTPSGGDAYLYNAITTDDVILTVNKATPVRYTDLSATPIAIFSEAGETLANSDITGGNVRYMRGSVWTDVPGDLATGWRWDTPGKSYATTGNNNEPVTFTPADPLRFNGITDTADIVVFSPKTRITMPPTASGIIYGSAVGSSALDDTLAEAIAVGVGAAPPNGTPITGTWTWSSPSVSATATGTISAEVKFIPTNLATPNPSDPPGGYLPATGYIPSTVMVNIAVAKADPAEDVIAPIGMGSGESLSSVPLISYNFTGAFGENVDGILTWKYPSVKPSDFLPGGIGIYPTVVVFTPTGTFADNYKVVEVPISVNVIVSKQPLIDLRDQIETLLGLIAVDIHAENYLAGAVTALQNALTAANIVIADVSATQTDVNDALEALQRAYGAMLHDHPVEAHSHRNGVTSPGQTVTIKIKGYFADVTSIKLGGTTYTLGPVDHGGPAPTRAILHGSATVGQIAEGSAVVTFYAAAIDALANGTYPLVVTFVDNIGTGYSVSSAVANSEILVNRPGDEDDDDEDDDDEDDDDEDDGDEDEDEDIGADEGGGAGSNARTGDNMNLLLWFALAMAAVIALLILRRLRRTDKN
jgi:hypothetical protein